MTTSRKTTNVESRATERPKRIPVSGEGRGILNVLGADPNYVYRWVNDDGAGRIERFKLGGWEFALNHSTGERSADSANSVDSMTTKKVGNNITAYLMRIKKEWYEEDQLAKNKRVDASEESMFRDLQKNDGGASHYGKVTFERK